MATPYSTCSSVIHDLQILRDLIGQSDGDRDKLLLQLEQACHIVAKFKAHLRELGAESEAAIANLMAALEKRTIISQGQGSLKELPSTMQPCLDNVRLYINKRMKEFSEAQLQICQICAEIVDNGLSIDSTSRQVNEPDLALGKMLELESHLRKDQREKVSGLGSLTPEVSEQAELEVERLNALKASKMKELF
ncbi:hypothetical protein NL676_003713 [Syzygium grande]|nr:hypothetical protein NL676_003713 [Syzygium grande]